MRGSTLRFFKLAVVTFASVGICLIVMANWVNQPWQGDSISPHSHEKSSFEKREVHFSNKNGRNNVVKKVPKKFHPAKKIQVLEEISAFKNWNDPAALGRQQMQQGPGEIGQPVILTDLDKNDTAKEKELFEQNGFNAFVSDQISLNRSIPDFRIKACATQRHQRYLTKASIIIPFKDEHWSTLLRTCYSVVLRTPAELLEEIILVDNNSTREFLGEKLSAFLTNLLPMVKLIRIQGETGLVKARMEGARAAKGRILVFLNSHSEVGYNWLPPLLDLLEDKPYCCIVPVVDIIDPDTFAYRSSRNNMQSIYDWGFNHHNIPAFHRDPLSTSRYATSAINAEGILAINSTFFWTLGGYDEGIVYPGGEQYELSLKIWNCGGTIYVAPCSRVASLVPLKSVDPEEVPDYVIKNYKRISMVWLDKMSKFVLPKYRDRFDQVDAGSVQGIMELKQKLQCETFGDYLKLAPLLPHFPPMEPPYYGYGTVSNVAFPELCMTQMDEFDVVLSECPTNKSNPTREQDWIYTHNEKVRLKNANRCIAVPKRNTNTNTPMMLEKCHELMTYWLFDLKSKWITHEETGECLQADHDTHTLVSVDCTPGSKDIMWEFAAYNSTAQEFYEKKSTQARKEIENDEDDDDENDEDDDDENDDDEDDEEGDDDAEEEGEEGKDENGGEEEDDEDDEPKKKPQKGKKPINEKKQPVKKQQKQQNFKKPAAPIKAQGRNKAQNGKKIQSTRIEQNGQRPQRNQKPATNTEKKRQHSIVKVPKKTF